MIGVYGHRIVETGRAQLPKGYTWCSEPRNPNYLNDAYFTFLREHGLSHVWLQGYYMPPIFGLYEKYADQFTDNVVICLHGPDREGIEDRTGPDRTGRRSSSPATPIWMRWRGCWGI